MLGRAVKENNWGSCYFYSWISLYLYVFSTKLDLHESLRNYASISSSIKMEHTLFFLMKGKQPPKNWVVREYVPKEQGKKWQGHVIQW